MSLFSRSILRYGGEVWGFRIGFGGSWYQVGFLVPGHRIWCIFVGCVWGSRDLGGDDGRGGSCLHLRGFSKIGGGYWDFSCKTAVVCGPSRSLLCVYVAYLLFFRGSVITYHWVPFCIPEIACYAAADVGTSRTGPITITAKARLI